MPRRRRNKVLIAIIGAGLLNFLAYTIIYAMIGGDAKNGKLIYSEQCMECHRYNGQGEMAFHSCPLTAFPDWYLAAQFEKFRRGGGPRQDVAVAQRHDLSRRRGPRRGEDQRDDVSRCRAKRSCALKCRWV